MEFFVWGSGYCIVYILYRLFYLDRKSNLEFIYFKRGELVESDAVKFDSSPVFTLTRYKNGGNVDGKNEDYLFLKSVGENFFLVLFLDFLLLIFFMFLVFSQYWYIGLLLLVLLTVRLVLYVIRKNRMLFIMVESILSIGLISFIVINYI